MTKGIKVFQQASHAGYVRRMVLEVDCNEIEAKALDLAIANAARSGARDMAKAVKRMKGMPESKAAKEVAEDG